MPSFLKKDKQILPYSFNAENTVLNLGALLFCALSLLAGFLISSSTILAIIFLAALLGIIIIIKPKIGLYLMVLSIPLEAVTLVVESLTVLKLLGWAVLAGWVLNVALTKKPIVFPREGWYLVAFIALGLVSAFWAVDPTRVIQSIPTLIQLLGFYIVVTNLVNTKEQVYHLYWSLLIGSLVAAGIVAYSFTGVYMGDFIRLTGERIGIGDVNYFAATLLLVVPFLFLSITFATSNTLRFYLLGAASMVLLSFFLAMSRGAILALTVILVVMLIKYRRHMSRLIIFIPICVVVALYFMPEHFWLRMAPSFTLEDSGAGRLSVWLVAWTMIKDNLLLGVGLSSFVPSFEYYESITTSLMRVYGYGRGAHSIYIGIVAELGIVGGLLLFMIIFGHLKCGYKAVRFYQVKEEQSGEILAMSVFLSFLGLLVMGATLNIIYAKFFWISMALTQAVHFSTSKVNFAEHKKILSDSS